MLPYFFSNFIEIWKIHITMSHHWFWWRLGIKHATSHYLNYGLIYWQISVSLGFNNLIVFNEISYQCKEYSSSISRRMAHVFQTRWSFIFPLYTIILAVLNETCYRHPFDLSLWIPCGKEINYRPSCLLHGCSSVACQGWSSNYTQ